MNRLPEPLSQRDVIEALCGLEVDGLLLSHHQARYFASAMWGRISEHRNRAYQLGYAHGYRNHNSACQGLAVKRDETVLFDLGGWA